MKIAEFLSLLDGVKPSREQWVARCPAHSDKTPSLSIAQGEETIIIHCFAGCRAMDVVQAMGLNLSDLWVENERSDRKYREMPVAWQALERELNILLLALDDRKSGSIEGQSREDSERERLAVTRIRYLLTELYK